MCRAYQSSALVPGERPPDGIGESASRDGSLATEAVCETRSMSAFNSSGSESSGQFRTFALALIGGGFTIVAVAVFVLGFLNEQLPPWWMSAGLLLLPVAAWSLSETLASRLPALEPGLDGNDSTLRAIAAYQSNMVLRFALVESTLFVGLLLSFVLGYGAWPAVLVGVSNLPLLAMTVWPNHRNVSRAERVLNRSGGRAQLVRALRA